MAAFKYMLSYLSQNHGQSNALILSVDYSTRPEAMLPKAKDECVAAYQHLVHDLSVSPGRILIGNMALSLVLRCIIIMN